MEGTQTRSENDTAASRLSYRSTGILLKGHGGSYEKLFSSPQEPQNVLYGLQQASTSHLGMAAGCWTDCPRQRHHPHYLHGNSSRQSGKKRGRHAPCFIQRRTLGSIAARR